MTKSPRLLAAAFALLWVVAAGFTPDVTYHLAPVIVAAAPAASADRRPLSWAFVGFGVAGAVAVALSSLGLLMGPSLLPVGGALVESIVGALIGAGLGAVLHGRVFASS